MKVIAPLTITEAMLTATTLPEADYATWSSGATYAAGDRRIKGHKIWESAAGSNTNHDPETDTNHDWWLEVGPTNRWAMFDGSVSTASTAAVDIEVEITPGAIVDALAIIAGVGNSVRVQMHDGATLVYDQTQSLDSTPIESWFDYFFADFALAGELLFQDLPLYRSGVITVTITASSGEASVGALVLGRLHDLGNTRPGASSGYIDYSPKETDQWGTTKFEKGAFARTSSQQMWLYTDQARRISAIVTGLRATPAVWIGDDNTELFGVLTVFGLVRNFSIDLPGPVISYCTLEIEGFT